MLTQVPVKPLTSIRVDLSCIVPATAHTATEVLSSIAVRCALLAHKCTVDLGCVCQGRFTLNAAEGLCAVYPVACTAAAGAVVCQRGCGLAAGITLDGVTAGADMTHGTLPAGGRRPQCRCGESTHAWSSQRARVSPKMQALYAGSIVSPGCVLAVWERSHLKACILSLWHCCLSDTCGSARSSTDSISTMLTANCCCCWCC